MNFKPRLSLKMAFVLTALSAVGIYYTPITYKASCDFLGESFMSRSPTRNNVDIQGRNRNQPFEDVILDVPLTFVERSQDPKTGRWDIEFKTNLYNYIKLRKYEILRFRNSK